MPRASISSPPTPQPSFNKVVPQICHERYLDDKKSVPAFVCVHHASRTDIVFFRFSFQDLNADDSLYRALRGVVDEEGAMDDFTDEQRRVVGLHMAEFERGGIHLSGKER